MTTNDSEDSRRESSHAYSSPATLGSDLSKTASDLSFERKLARLCRTGYVTGVLAVVVSLSFVGINSEPKLVVTAGLSVLAIAAGISYFFLHPIPDPGPEQEPKAIRPAQRLGQGCLFLVMWVVIQGACWFGITIFSWPTRFVPNEIFGGGNKIVVPDAITIAFWTQLFVGLALTDRFRVFAFLQLFAAAFIMSRPSFYRESDFGVRFHVPIYVWVAFWIQFALMAAALWRFSCKRDTTVNDSGNKTK